MALTTALHTDGRWCRRAIAVLVIVAGLAASAQTASAQSARRYQGRAVADVLHELQAAGARILFASALVPPELGVKAEPRAKDPRAIAEEILAPHGLALKDGPGKTWLVVRAVPATRSLQPATPPSPAPVAPVPDEPSDQLVIRIDEQVSVIDRFDDLAAQPSVQRLDPQKVLDTAGGLENVFQVLPLLPGAAATNDEDGKLAVRGGGPEHNVVLFDGVQVYSPQRTGDFGTSFVNPATAQSVALDASGLDARYGGRLSSVTVLETRNGATDRRLAISGSAGLTSGDVIAEGRLPGTQSGSWWTSARGTYYKFVAERFRDETIPSFADVQFKINARPSTRTQLSLVGLVGKEAMVRREGGFQDSGALTGDIAEELHADNRLAAINFWFTPGPRLTTATTFTAYSSAFRYQDHWNRPVTGPFDRDVRVTDFAVRQRATLAWAPRHVLDAGFEVRRLSSSWAMMSNAFVIGGRPVGPDIWGGFVDYDGPIDSRIRKTQLGTWVQDRMLLGADVSMEPGVRVDWNSLTGESALQPRVRLTKRIGRTSIWTGLAWQAQTPGHETMQQGLQYFDLTGPEASSLRNEQSRQVVVGVEHEIAEGTTVRVEAYRRAFDRLLVQRQETETERADRLSRYEIPAEMPPDSAILEFRPTVHPESTGTGRATGLEMLLQRARGRLTGWVSYTLSKAERELYGNTVPFDFDRRHALAVAANAQLTSKLRLSATSQYATGFALTPLHPEAYFGDHDFTIPPRPPGPFKATRRSSGELLMMNDPRNALRLSLLNSARMPAYARTDVRVTYALANWVEVYGEVINLFNRENFHPQSTFGPSDTAGEYEVAASLGRLPTYGVRLRF